uniref:Uncharacterized protein n=1 Tax=Romanomermis culicivorax TaxID=13658 RepID=A0A915IA56_ROMCU
MPSNEKINNQPLISPDENLFRNLRSGDQRLKHAYLCHRNLCWLLLTAYEALELKFTQFIQYLPKQCQIRIQSVDCAKKFEILQQNLQRITDENEISRSVLNTSKLLSSELSLLWRQFLDLFKRQTAVNKFLAVEHHNARVRRFGESFLCCESTTQYLSSSTSGDRLRTQEKLVEFLRKSQYFLNVPLLAVSCDILDGSPELTPIIFEEKYQPASPLRSDFSHILSTNFQLSFHSTPNFFSSLTTENIDKKNGDSVKNLVEESSRSRQRNHSDKIDKKSLKLNFRRVFTPNFDVKKKNKQKRSTHSIKKNVRSRSSSYFERETIDRSLALKLSIRSQSAEYICADSARSVALSTNNFSRDNIQLDFIDRSSESSSPYNNLIDQDIIKASDSLSPIQRNSPSPTPARLTSGVDEDLL